MKRRFLVTCATGDIGTELCLHLAKKGHDLIITARRSENLQRLTERITSEYPDVKVHYYPADLGDPNTMRELVEQATALGIDGIVLMPPRPPQLPDDPALQFRVLNKAMQDCFTGPRFLLQQLLPTMKDSDLKSVVLVSGASSKQVISNASWEAFNDIRSAWVGCFKTFADLYGKEGIRFNTISPGQVLTPTYTAKVKAEAQTHSKLFTDVLREKTVAVPLQKFATIREIIKPIYFLLKSSGASAITATNTLVDGGSARPY